MDALFELILAISKTLQSIPIVCFAGLMFVGSYLYDRLDQPKSLSRMRLLCHTEKWMLVLYILLILIQVTALFVPARRSESPKAYDLLWMFGSILFFGYLYYRLCRYYLKNPDDQQVIGRWHMQRYFYFSKQHKFKRAYEQLEKASKFITDNVYIWATLAWKERLNIDHSIADNYLAKAKEAFIISPQSTRDEANIENVTGQVLLCRKQITESLPHLEKACNLWPENEYAKDCYEKALRSANNPDELENDTADSSFDFSTDTLEDSEDIECPPVLNGLSQMAVIIGIALILLASFSFVDKLLQLHENDAMQSLSVRFASVALLCVGLIAGGLLCPKAKRLGWHVLSFSLFAMGLNTSDFFYHLIKSKGVAGGTIFVAFFSLLLIFAYVYLFTDQPRAFLKVHRPRSQIFLFHVALYVAAHALVNFLRWY